MQTTEQKVLKKTGQDGKTTYALPNGTPISAYRETLEEVADQNLAILEEYFDLVSEAWADKDVGKIGTILVEHARRCIEEVADFISENYGTVQVERAIHGQPMVEDSQLLGVAFEPAKPPGCN
jgi:hypothetical protein